MGDRARSSTLPPCKAPGQCPKVVPSTTTMSESETEINSGTGLHSRAVQVQPRRRPVESQAGAGGQSLTGTITALPTPVPGQEGCGQGTRPGRMSWTRKDNKALMSCYYNSRPKEKGFMRRMEALWKELRPDSILDMKQLNNQRYSIVRKKLLSGLELEELERLTNPGTIPTVPQETTSAETGNGHTDLDPVEASVVDSVDLPEELQALRHLTLDRLRTELSDRSYLPKLRKNIPELLIQNMNVVLETIPTSDITETNALIYAAARTLLEQSGIMRPQQPQNFCNAWQIRLEKKIKKQRAEVSKLSTLASGIAIRDARLRQKYQDTTPQVALEIAKQRLTALAARLKRYTREAESRRINRLFTSDPSKVYSMLRGNGPARQQQDPPMKDTELFWKGIWGKEAVHNGQASWLEELKHDWQPRLDRQQPVTITECDIRRRVTRMKNWTAPGPDMIHAYWLKKFTALHSRLAWQMERLITTGDHPSWLTLGRTVLIMKNPDQGAVPKNYRPITCLSTTWKLLSGIIADKIQEHVCEYMHTAQKGIGVGSRGSKHQLLIDRTVTKDSRTRRTNLAMAWIDYKKAYDSVPHTWILESLRLHNIEPGLIAFIQQSMTHWKTKLYFNSKSTAEIKINCGIYQGDALSPLLFCIALNPLSVILDKSGYSYKFKSGNSINHLFYMDDIKLYAKNERDIDSLIHLTRVFSSDIGMTFGLEKCGRLIVNRGNTIRTQGIDLPEGHIDDVTESYKYLGILQSHGNHDEEVRSNAVSEYRKRVRQILKSRLSARNQVTAINTFAVPVIRYTAATVNWRQEDLRAADIGTRKLMTLHGAFHPKSSVARLYSSRKEGGRGLQCLEHAVKEEEQSLKSYVETQAITDPLMAECQDTVASWTTQPVIPDWYSKPLHGAWHTSVTQVADIGKTYQWLNRTGLEMNTEALIMAAQEQALNTRAVAAEIYHTTQDPHCRLCGEHRETVAHLVSGCSKLAGTAYTDRHNYLAAIVYRAICSKYGLEHSRKPKDTPEKVVQNDRVKLLWDFHIQTDIRLKHNQPDIVLVDRQDKTCLIIDIAVPRDENIREKEQEKVSKYEPLRIELERLWNVDTKVVPVVVGALGAVTTHLSQWLSMIPGDIKEVDLQKSALLGTCRLLRHTLKLPGLW